ncbi:sugar phosphate isomerase [Aspergillus taichungensis]|uniref:Sugar phosphate isomerase n=1 Tax=Aspergillus taichungensis TaxID=482145 RepID=A0A2J5I7U2_9EURO|nr:sugar phosphate isomerase [Aspergillus taichungensis]
MPTPWPPTTIPNEPGIATFSLGNSQHHKLQPRLEEAAKAGYKQIDLFDECWAAYLEEHGLPRAQLWDATAENLAVAQKLGNLVKSLGMRIACTQPARNIEGIKDAAERRAALDLVAQRFPFMRAFDTDLLFLCASVRKDAGVTSDLQTVARDLAELGDMAKAYSDADGGRPLRIGYEGLSWATRNTWASTWEAVRAANRPNVGLVLDTFNMLAVEFADPYNPAGHGRVYATLGESIDVLCASLAALVATVPGDRIFFFQVADAKRMDPATFRRPTDANVPALMPWSRAHRLYPFEESRGGYLPVQLVVAAVIATGYQGPVSLEVFNSSLNQPESDVPAGHARRGIEGLRKLTDAIPEVPAFWEMWQQGCRQFRQITSSMRPERL